MGAKDPHLEELGQFLRARRAEVDPNEIGLPYEDRSARRVSGLRREEVAARVAISHDYYTRIEQGRLAPSEPVLDVIAQVLHLTPDQRDYVERLAQQADRRTPPRPRSTPVRPQIQRLLDQLTNTPAMVVGKYLYILGWNDLAAALTIDYAQLPAQDRNYVRLIFTDPRYKAFYADEWETMARSAVATLRMQAVDNPRDPRLCALVGELSLTSPQFRQWWAARQVSRPDFGNNKLFRHPAVGELPLDWDAFAYVGDPDQQLVLWSAPPGSSSYDKLRILASLSLPNAVRDCTPSDR